MTDYTQLTVEELEHLSAQYERETFRIMKELIRRDVGRVLPDTLEHPSMIPTEEDF